MVNDLMQWKKESRVEKQQVKQELVFQIDLILMVKDQRDQHIKIKENSQDGKTTSNKYFLSESLQCFIN